MAKHGINPVTIRPKHGRGKSIVLARMHVGLDPTHGEAVQKLVTGMTVDESQGEGGLNEPATVDEDTFIDALQHLFPHGELYRPRTTRRGYEHIPVATDAEIEKARELLAAFLEGMGELRVSAEDIETWRIVDECHGGDVREYVKYSFDQFCDQVVEEADDADAAPDS